MIWQTRHRVINEIEKKLAFGKNLIILTGEAIWGHDVYFYSLLHGIQDLASSLKLFYLSAASPFEYFIHISNSMEHARFFQKTDAGIRELGTDEFFEAPRMTGVLNLNKESDKEEQRKAAQEAAGRSHNPVSATAERLLQALTQRRSSKFLIFFESLHWLARLHDSPQETRVLSFIFEDCAKLANVNSILSVYDVKALENVMRAGEEIYLGKPAPNEIFYAFLRYLLRLNKAPAFDPLMLDQLAHHLGAGKKSLSNCMRILKQVLRKNPDTFSLADFESSFERGIEEKVAWRDVHLQEDTRKYIENIIDEFIRTADKPAEKGASMRGLLLCGPPGTGKTMIAKALANEKKCSFMAFTLADLKGEFVGQSSAKVKSIFAQARANQPAILFIDEADTVFPSRDDKVNSDSFNRDMVNQFLVEMDGASSGAQKIFVIAATNREHAIDRAVKSRFGKTCDIPLPDAAIREKIFDDQLANLQREKPFLLSRSSFLGEALARSEGMSGRDIENFVKPLFLSRPGPLADDEATKLHFQNCFAEEEKRVFNRLQTDVFSCGEILDPVNVLKTAENIIGMEAAKAVLERQARYLSAPDEARGKYESFGVRVPRGVLLYGPPGNGKSEVVKWLAAKYGFYFFKVLSKDFVESYAKDQLDRLERIFTETIRFSQTMKYPGLVLFFDEFDSLAGERLDSAVRGTLLNYLTDKDGLRSVTSRIMFVAATNYEEQIDEAVKRPGRIDSTVYIANPSQGEGVTFLKELTIQDGGKVHFPDETIAKAWESRKCLKARKVMNSGNLLSQISRGLPEPSKNDTNPSFAELKNMYNELKFLALENNSFRGEMLDISDAVVEYIAPDGTGQKKA